MPRRALADELPFGILRDVPQSRADLVEGRDVLVSALEVADGVVGVTKAGVPIYPGIGFILLP